MPIDPPTSQQLRLIAVLRRGLGLTGGVQPQTREAAASLLHELLDQAASTGPSRRAAV
jgi:hypothetical protein